MRFPARIRLLIHQGRFWLLAPWLVLGCAGPMPLEHAIRPQDEAAYTTALETDPDEPRTAFLRWTSAERGISFDQARARDERLTRNPFEASDPRAVSLGAIVYSNHCMECHGVDADGEGWTALQGHPAQSFRTPMVRLGVTLAGGPQTEWFERVRDGNGPIVAYPDGRQRAMPAFGDLLTNEQIWLALTYLASPEK